MSEPAATTMVPSSPLPAEASHEQLRRFVVAQIVFLLITPLTGGFRFQAWSMLDTALMLAALGITALIPVMDTAPPRRFVLRVAIGLYVLAILDMSINVVVSGVVGWR